MFFRKALQQIQVLTKRIHQFVDTILLVKNMGMRLILIHFKIAYNKSTEILVNIIK